jgi:hypothetical protein
MRVAPPQQQDEITLPALKYEDGSPVVVKVRRLSAVEYGEIQGALPARGPGANNRARPSDVLEVGWNLILAAAVEPAFTRASEPQGEAIPVEWLGQDDATAIIRCATRLLGISEAPSFRDGDGAGVPVGGTAE